jgi:hypothetical protein
MIDKDHPHYPALQVLAEELDRLGGVLFARARLSQSEEGRKALDATAFFDQFLNQSEFDSDEERRFLSICKTIEALRPRQPEEEK